MTSMGYLLRQTTSDGLEPPYGEVRPPYRSDLTVLQSTAKAEGIEDRHMNVATRDRVTDAIQFELPV